MREVVITYELEVPDDDETYKVDLECRISDAEKEVGWLGHLESYDVLAVSPAWSRGKIALYDALDGHRAAIEELAFSTAEEDR